MHGRHKAEPFARYGLHVARAGGIVVQRLADSLDGGVQRGVVIDHHLATPQTILRLLARNQVARMLQQQLTQVGLTAVSATLGGIDPAARGAVLALFGAGAQFGVLLPFGRDMESEADHIGLIYMARAGYNPEAAVALWQRMAERREGPQLPEYASTHPSDETRIKNLEKWLPEARREYEKATANGAR